jgi:hypothetical protein
VEVWMRAGEPWGNLTALRDSGSAISAFAELV